jgi:uncharacterized RDD family membrane protein YckC
MNAVGATACFACQAVLGRLAADPAILASAQDSSSVQTDGAVSVSQPAVPPIATLRKLCDRCRTPNDVAARFCGHCGWPLENAKVVSQDTLKPAGFWIRLAAYILDVILIGIVAGVGGAAYFAVAQVTDENQLWPNLAAQVGTVLYFVILLWLKGASFGMMMLGMKVVRHDGAKLSFLRSLARNLALSVIMLPTTIGTFLAFLTDMDLAAAVLLIVGSVISVVFAVTLGSHAAKRGWHDLIAGTMVIRTR